MARHGIALVTAFTSLIPLSACSFSEEPLNLDFEATAISPEPPFTCDDEGECDEPGAVRWSLPLEGDHFLYWPDGDDDKAPILSSEFLLRDEERSVATGTYGDGVLYLVEGDRITAVDTSEPAALWTEAVDPERPKDIRFPRMVGGGIALVTARTGDDDTMYAVVPGSAGAEWHRVDIPASYHSDPFLRDDGTRVLVDPYAHENAVIDAQDGSVAWSGYFAETGGAREVLSDDTAAIADDAAYTFKREPVRDHFSRILRWDTSTGELAEEIELGDDADIPSKAALVAADSDVLLASTGSCEQTPCSSPGGLWGLDPRTGELLWERSDGSEEKATFIALEDGEHGTGVLMLGPDGAPFMLDPRTGEAVDTVASHHLPSGFGTEQTHPSPGRFLWSSPGPGRQERLSAPLQVTGPGLRQEEFLLGLGLGTRYVTSYTEGGRVLGVFMACAPDGLKPVERDDIDATEQCTSPRLFAVDYGL